MLGEYTVLKIIDQYLFPFIDRAFDRLFDGVFGMVRMNIGESLPGWYEYIRFDNQNLVSF